MFPVYWRHAWFNTNSVNTPRLESITGDILGNGEYENPFTVEEAKDFTMVLHGTF